MADVCELAHNRTVRDCRKRRIQVDCDSFKKCGDDGQDHDDEDMTHYTKKAQGIFDAHYEHICAVTGI